MTNEKFMEAVEISENQTEVKQVKSNTIVIRSYRIARQLVVDRGYFSSLFAIHKDKYDPDGKRHIWLFKRNTEIEKAFNQLVAEAKESKINKE